MGGEINTFCCGGRQNKTKQKVFARHRSFRTCDSREGVLRERKRPDVKQTSSTSCLRRPFLLSCASTATPSRRALISPWGDYCVTHCERKGISP